MRRSRGRCPDPSLQGPESTRTGRSISKCRRAKSDLSRPSAHRMGGWPNPNIDAAEIVTTALGGGGFGFHTARATIIERSLAGRLPFPRMERGQFPKGESECRKDGVRRRRHGPSVGNSFEARCPSRLPRCRVNVRGTARLWLPGRHLQPSQAQTSTCRGHCCPCQNVSGFRWYLPRW